MKTDPSHHRRGMALVIVLALMVLITVLVVGFLARAGGERTASASYHAAAVTRQLADTAVNLVQAQINEATTEGAGTYAWASQPGALRVFDNSGQLQKIYRLYSATSLVTAGADATILKQDIPIADWATNPALWVDLNAPVTVSSGSQADGTYSIFPILDPRDPLNPGSFNAPSVTGTMSGFFLSGTVPGSTTVQPVPMPVQWLYVLQDGQMVAPSTKGGNQSVTVAGASASNPIVGRIAFWTDDECSKVNINTAVGSMSVRPDASATSSTTTALLPAPWDIPRFNIWDETRLFSQNQPVHGEYQRYPGHPATTDLYGILKALGVSLSGYPPVADASYPGPTKMAQPTGEATEFSTLLPRYGDAFSSMGGTVYTTNHADVNLTGGANVNLANSRLYTSLGEMYYTSGTNTRTPNNLSRQQLESGKFFLTAHSRAPEVNLFGKPRIAMWPIDSRWGSNPVTSNVTQFASTFDKLIAFCSTTGTGSGRKAYYIQRRDATSATADAGIQRNMDLYGYLQRLASTNIPGFGGTFGDKYGLAESDQILTEMVDYVRSTNVYDRSRVVSSGSFTFTPSAKDQKFNGASQVVPLQIETARGSTQGLGRMFTLSEIGLHIICTADGNSDLNYQAVSAGGTSSVRGAANDYRYVSNLPVDQFLLDTSGTVCGLYSGTTAFTGTGTYPTANAFRQSQPYVTGGTKAFPRNPTLSGTLLAKGQKRLQAMLIMETQCPMQGYEQIWPDFQVRVSDLSNVNIGGVNPFPARCNGTLSAMLGRSNSWDALGGYQQYCFLMTKQTEGGANKRASGWSNVIKRPYPEASVVGSAADNYLYVSDPFTVADSGTGTISIGGGTFQIELLVSGTAIQTFHVTFPSQVIPSPDLMQYGLLELRDSPAPAGNHTSAWDWWGFDNRIPWANGLPMFASMASRSSVFRADPANSTPASTAGTWNFMTGKSDTVRYSKDSKGVAELATSPSDVVRSLIARDGDIRLVMAKKTVTADGTRDMIPTAGYKSTSTKIAHSFVYGGLYNTVYGSDRGGKLVPNATYSDGSAPKVPSDVTPIANWDWDSGMVDSVDGAYANKPDEGCITDNGVNPYFKILSATTTQEVLASYFTANRIIPSPVMFGSLPTGVKANVPWRTLHFRPMRGGSYEHDQLGGPADHLILDWFTMPVVEPYAISEPFSTAGKINMNYQIVPFHYINRSVGLRAVLGSELIARVPLASGTIKYKSGNNSAAISTVGGVSLARLPMNLDEDTGTLRQFQDKFAKWEIFKSPSEICELFLVPKPYSWNGFPATWYGDDFALVGDNVRERPYADIYPRLTTKSNTYTVHFRVQSLKNPTSNKPDTWRESSGVITGEYRGSTTIERYLDPGNNNIPDYATDPTARSLDTYYQWRTISNTSFAP